MVNGTISAKGSDASGDHARRWRLGVGHVPLGFGANGGAGLSGSAVPGTQAHLPGPLPAVAPGARGACPVRAEAGGAGGSASITSYHAAE